jgi:predicted nucleic acid-binding protein
VVHLLDVNVLLAMFDTWHAFHLPARAWFATNRHTGWATCPITENGFIHIGSHSGYANKWGDATEVAERLAMLCNDRDYHFWSADVRLQDVVKPGVVFTHTHVTDLYLLGLAIRNSGKLATLDRRIPATLIEGGPEALTVIPV